ncbi:MAG: hypothetical protein AAAB35_25355 [Phyllobacterium sp.]|uniref:hypothetical protein n=1 Tax=Phyllobacterium sp. TaxID=1871046 RepID=UPI0030F1A90D
MLSFKPIWVTAFFFPIILLLFTAPSSSQSPNEGRLVVRNADGGLVETYSRDRLRAEFPMHELTTATPWSSGERLTFRGPLLGDILTKNGIAGAEIEVAASNEFVAKVRAEEIGRFLPILAMDQQCTAEDQLSGICNPGQFYRPLSMEDGRPLYLVWPLHNLPATYVPAAMPSGYGSSRLSVPSNDETG